MLSPMRSLLCDMGKPCPDMSALRAQDPYIEHVVAYCEYTVSYLLDETEETAKWEMTDIRGPVYLLRRRDVPRYQLLIKSFDGSQSILDDVDPEWDLDPKENYLFYKTQHPQDQIRGLWFQHDASRREFTEAIEGAKIALATPHADTILDEGADENFCVCCLPSHPPHVKVETYFVGSHFSADPGSQSPYAPRKTPSYVPMEIEVAEVVGYQKPPVDTPSTGCPTSPDLYTPPYNDEHLRNLGTVQPSVDDGSVKPTVPFFNFDSSIPYSYGNDGL